MIPRFSSALLLFLLFASAPAIGQRLLFHHLSTENGLSQSVNEFVRRDRQGFVWISSTDGLNRFDGTSVRVYRNQPGRPRSLQGNNIFSPTYEDAAGNLWFSTDLGLNRYDRAADSFDLIHLNHDKSITEQYRVFFQDKNGFLWIDAGSAGTWRVDTKAPLRAAHIPAGKLNARAHYPATNPLTGELVRLYATHPSTSGVAVFENSSDTLRPAGRLFDGQNGMPALRVTAVLASGDNVLWLASDTALIRYDLATHTWKVLSQVQGISLKTIRKMLEISADEICLATADVGLLLFNTQSNALVQYAHSEAEPLSIASDRLKNLYFDAEQRTLWVSIWGYGVDFSTLNKAKFGHVRLPHISGDKSKPLFMPSVLAPDGNRGIWCASPMDKGLRLLSTDGQLLKDYSPQTGAVYDLISPAQGPAFFCSDQGTQYKRSNSERFYPVLDCKTREAVWINNLFEARNRKVYGSDNGGGLLEITPTQGGGYCAQKIAAGDLDGISLGRLYEENSGRGYAESFTDGVLVLEGSVPEGRIRKKIKVDGEVKFFTENSNYVWAAGSFGLLRIDKQTLQDTLLNERNGLPTRTIYGALAAGDEVLWLSSNAGLIRYNLRDNTFDQFEQHDGLQANEFNSASCLAAPDGRFWFGGIKGLNVFDPKSIGLVATPPKMQITGILVNDGPHPFSSNVTELRDFTLKSGQNTVSFSFAALEYSDPAHNKLRYRLEKNGNPVDKDWVPCADARGFVRYAMLEPGDYRFRVQGENSDGVPSAEERAISFTVLPPFYRSTWFILTVLGLLAGGLYAAYRNRLDQERLERDAATARLNSLFNNLNIHFLRNCLANLSGMMTDLQKAQNYISDFANLMTGMLQNSRQVTVSIESEVDLLHKYLLVEQQRFPEGNLRYQLPEEDDIEPAGMQVPAMILQPFVENAIKHGLAPRAGAGTVVVEARQEGQRLLCIVQDDGVGRNHPSSSRPGHRSHAIAMTVDYLKIYDQQNRTHSSLDIIDLQDDQQRPLGTRVELRLGIPPRKKRRRWWPF